MRSLGDKVLSDANSSALITSHSSPIESASFRVSKFRFTVDVDLIELQSFLCVSEKALVPLGLRLPKMHRK